MHTGVIGAFSVAGKEETLRREHGLALVLVLWVLSLLAIIAGGFVFSTRTHTVLSGNLVSLAQAEALADAGVHRALYEMQIPRPELERWRGDGRPHLWEYQGNVIQITISDESAKIDLNTANELLLKLLFRYAGLDDAAAGVLLDVLIDWRDADSLRRPNGAEAEDYIAAGRKYTPTNQRFRSIAELRQILGMNDDIYRRIANLITVYSNQPGFNSAIASRELLLAIPGADPAQVDAFIVARDAIQPGQPKPIFPVAQAFHSGDSSVLSIRAEARMVDNTTFIREAVVRLPVPGRQVLYLAWRAPDVARPENQEGVVFPTEQNGKQRSIK